MREGAMAIRGIGQADDSPVSKSAMLVATACAVVARDPVYRETLNDTYAEWFARAISDQARATLATLDDDETRRRFIEQQEAQVAGLITHVLYRKTWMAERVERSVQAGARQVVIFGAGCDTLSLRLGEHLQNVRVFEIDRPETIAFRREVLSAHDALRDNVHMLGIDFGSQDVKAALLDVGYDPALLSVFISEAVMEYLTPEEVDAVFRLIRENAPYRSRFLFTFLATTVFEDDSLADAREELAEGGESLRFGLAPETLDAFLKERGFRRLDLATPRWFENYFAPRVGAPVGVIPGFHFVLADRIS